MKTSKLIKEGFSEYEAEVIQNYSEFSESKTQIASYELRKTIKRIMLLVFGIVVILIYKNL